MSFATVKFKVPSFSAGLLHPFNRASRESVSPDLNQTRASGFSIREYPGPIWYGSRGPQLRNSVRGSVKRGQGHYVLRLLLPPKFIEAQ